MLDSFLSHPQMPYYSSILPWFFFVKGAPCALRAKTKRNQSQEREATLLGSYILETDGKVGAWGLKHPLINHATPFAN